MILGFDGEQNAKKIAEALKPYWKEENIFIVSTDFSHYPSYNDAVNIDLATANAIVSGKPEELIKVVNSETGIKNLSTNCCAWRSEEHTSELQSRPHLVCRLLLEKKNKI